jgi:hypothetical protein
MPSFVAIESSLTLLSFQFAPFDLKTIKHRKKFLQPRRPVIRFLAAASDHARPS